VEQFNRLAPVAVRYTAAMINFIHKYLYKLTGAGVCDEELDVTVSGTGTVSSVRVGSSGTVPAPSQFSAMPGGQPANFTVLRMPATVTIGGPSGAFVLFTLQPISGPPPCSGAGCPVSISGVAPVTLAVTNGNWWFTCYVPPTYTQTSNQQVSFIPQQTLTMSCPP
jgi:hypothetical protein